MRKDSPDKFLKNLPLPVACVKTTFKHEFQKCAYTLSTLVFLAAFLFFLNFCIFIVGDFLDSNLATLSLQWKFLPWLSIIFLPALAMQAFRGYLRGSGDLILSYPIPSYSIIIGKWLAGVTLILFVLILTVPFALTVETLGELDWGIAFAGYLSAFLAMSLFYSIALLAAAICKDEISSFLLGVSCILLLLFFDINALQTSLVPNSLRNISYLIFLLSPKHWMDEIATGNINLSGIAYFVSFTGLCLALSCYQLRGHFPATNPHYFKPVYGILGLLFINLVSSGLAVGVGAINLNLDVTEYKEYTFRQETKTIARRALPGTEIVLYVSEDRSTIPPNIIQHMDRVERAISNISKQSNGRIDATIKSLQPDTELAEIAESLGVRKLSMSSGDTFYFGAVFKVKNLSLVTSYFDYNRAASLEYDLALQLSNLSRERTPNVGIISSLLKPANVNVPHPGLSILEELKSQYDVSIIPYFAEGISEKYDALIILDVPMIRKKTLVDIDRHMQEGRGVVLLIDPFQRMNNANASLNVKPSLEGEINSISDLLAYYGLEFSVNEVLGDFINAATVESNEGHKFSYPYWLKISTAGISKNHVVSANLSELLFAEAGFFTVNTKNLRVEPLVLTSAETSMVSKKVIQKNSTKDLALSFKSEKKKRGILAAHVSGVLQSPFSKKSDKAQNSQASLFVVSDVDWIYNGFSLADSRMDDRVFSRPINDNHRLFLNMVEHITGDKHLTEIRSRKSPIRTFTSIENMLLKNRQLYHEKETEYAAQIKNIEQSIARVLSVAGAQNIEDLPADIREQIKDLKVAIYPIKRELRDIRLKMRESVDDKFKKLTLANLLAGPLLALFTFVLLSRRRRVES